MDETDDLAGYPEIVWAKDTPARRLRRMQDQARMWTTAVWSQAQRAADAGDRSLAEGESLMGIMAAQTLLTLARQIVTTARSMSIDVSAAEEDMDQFAVAHSALPHFRDVFSHPEDYQYGAGRYQLRDGLPSGLWVEGFGRELRASLAGTHRDYPIHSLMVVPMLEQCAALGTRLLLLDAGPAEPAGWLTFSAEGLPSENGQPHLPT